MGPLEWTEACRDYPHASTGPGSWPQAFCWAPTVHVPCCPSIACKQNKKGLKDCAHGWPWASIPHWEPKAKREFAQNDAKNNLGAVFVGCPTTVASAQPQIVFSSNSEHRSIHPPAIGSLSSSSSSATLPLLECVSYPAGPSCLDKCFPRLAYIEAPSARRAKSECVLERCVVNRRWFSWWLTANLGWPIV